MFGRKVTLYDKIRKAEEIGKDLTGLGFDTTESRFMNDLKDVDGIDGIHRSQLESPEYSNNEYLTQALESEKTLEKTAKELVNQKYNGFRRLLPHRKDKKYNEQIDRLGELVHAEDLRTRGVLVPDNFTTLAGYITASSFLICNTIPRAIFRDFDSLPQDMQEAFTLYLPAISTVFFTFFGGVALFGSSVRHDSSCTTPIQQARYIDDKIFNMQDQELIQNNAPNKG